VIQLDREQKKVQKPSDLIVLRYDGIYFKKHESGFYFVLRFYEDGIVCGGYINSNPKNACVLFNPRTANHGHSLYSIAEDSVTFSFVLDEGFIDYNCSSSGKKLNCDILSTITKRNMKWEYKFVKF